MQIELHMATPAEEELFHFYFDECFQPSRRDSQTAQVCEDGPKNLFFGEPQKIAQNTL